MSKRAGDWRQKSYGPPPRMMIRVPEDTLRQVREALMAVLDIEPQLVGRVTYNKAAAALALLAELGVRDVHE